MLAALTPQEVTEACSVQSSIIGRGAQGTVYRCTIRGRVFAAKHMQNKADARKEYNRAVSLVEHVSKHPGFKVILHYRHYIDLPDKAVILMDPCEQTLSHCLSHEKEFRLKRLLPNPTGEVVAQVLQGLHYLAFVARVSHNDLHLNNVMRKSRGRWCIIDFGTVTDILDPSVSFTLDFANIFAYEVLKSLLLESGKHVVNLQDKGRSYTKESWLHNLILLDELRWGEVEPKQKVVFAMLERLNTKPKGFYIAVAAAAVAAAAAAITANAAAAERSVSIIRTNHA